MAHSPVAESAEITERQALVLALQRTRGNKQQAAKLLKISRGTLYRRLRDHGLDKLIRKPFTELEALL